VYQILKQLRSRGWNVTIFGSTIFDNPRGIAKLKPHWESIKNNPDRFVNINDDQIVHHLYVTSSTNAEDMTYVEANGWYNSYLNLLNETRPDLVFFYGGTHLDVQIPLEARRLGIPSVAYLVNERYSGTRWMRDVDLIVTDTKATSMLYESLDGFKVHAIGKFIPLRGVISADNTRTKVVFVNASVEKGAMLVAAVAMMMEERFPKIQFEVVESRGDWATVLADTQVALGQKPRPLLNVRVRKNTANIAEIYQNARIVLAPSLWWESGARVLVESLLNGVPVVTTMYGGSQELLGDAAVYIKLPKAFHVQPYNQIPSTQYIESISNIINRFFNDDRYYRDYSERAKNQSQKFDIEANTDQLIKLLSSLTSELRGNQDFYTLNRQNHKHHLPLLAGDASRSGFDQDAFAITYDSNKSSIFIDCGGYDGCSATKFVMRYQFFDSITFEPNPALWHYYATIPTALVKKAVYISNQAVDLIIDDIDGDGSSLMESKKIDFFGTKPNEKFQKIPVECLDIVEIINKASELYDQIVLKLDIEGAEYEVLQRLLDFGLVSKIKVIYAEFHWNKCEISEDRHLDILEKLRREVAVIEWDALDYSVHCRPEKDKLNREYRIKSSLKSVADYQTNRLYKSLEKNFAN
jgi:FkbM family methyltransferase